MMDKEVICRVCKTIVLTNQVRQFYCSETCRNKGKSKRVRAKVELNWNPKLIELTENDYNIEEWVSIEDTNYEVSNMGRVKNSNTAKLLKPSKNKIDGYWYVGLPIGTRKLHRMVAQYFIPNPVNKKFVDHKKGNKDDNRYYALRWVTFQENIDFAWQEGLYNNKGSLNSHYILVEENVIEIKKMLSKGIMAAKIMESFPMVRINAIYDIKQGRTWKHVTI